MERNYLFFWLSACLVFAVDRLTKVWAERNLQLGDSVTGIDGWYQWTLYHNPGAAGGIWSGHSGWLALISILAVLGILWFIYRGPHDRNLLLLLGLGLMFGGALGNLYDRVLYAYVIDFIDPVGKTYVYNLADKGIRWGLYLSIIGLWCSGRTLAKESQNVVS
ncbi:signal peptidase II [Tumebacillus permanentifrigoris]|uniref:Lipoprotein signal peptidase n=1 Tax=Tumebacillus permanentifrigoris TaxID=378543 RepID=A0A316D792_9BACL|nr:signal peptidase II [Tumebacillus permanentifrigoris]PWK11590.1 signal peptidase II [Tumebacillus permanentifrigoris]